MNIERSKNFIRNNMTDDECHKTLNDDTVIDNEENRVFLSLIKEELDWRNNNNRHYTKEQKTADTLALIKDVEESVKNNTVVVKRKKWWELE